jgi:hypothetical protein
MSDSRTGSPAAGSAGEGEMRMLGELVADRTIELGRHNAHLQTAFA